MTTVTKDTNPKDIIGSTKLPMSLVPDTLKVYATMAYAEGALKYGRYNWRATGVRMSVYKDAFERHAAKFWNGEWADPVTKVPHLGSMMACLGIIADAHECGVLTDDRPPVAPTSTLIDESEATIKHLQEIFAGYTPHQHTIAD